MLSACQRPADPGAVARKEQRKELAQVPPLFFRKVNSSYEDAKAGCVESRNALSAKYRNATSDSSRQKILSEAREAFTRRLVNDLIPFWYGTAWDFDGYTAEPGKGTTACGYFVSTTLLHAGLKVNRYKLAQQTPCNEARSISLNDEVLTLSDLNADERKIRLDGMKEGLYFVGLDYHVGYLYRSGENCYFIHSNYYNAQGVTIEPVETSMAFQNTTTYYIAPITGNDELILKWLRRGEIVVRTGGAL